MAGSADRETICNIGKRERKEVLLQTAGRGGKKKNTEGITDCRVEGVSCRGDRKKKPARERKGEPVCTHLIPNEGKTLPRKGGGSRGRKVGSWVRLGYRARSLSRRGENLCFQARGQS